MKNLNTKLLIEQFDRKLNKPVLMSEIQTPGDGWIKTIRSVLNMSLVQLSKKLNITPVSVREVEQREEKKSITLKKLSEVAEALDCHLVYAMVPKEGSVEKMIEKRAYEVAREIVLRTSQSMKLENQENSEERISRAIKDRAEKIKNELPRYLWD